MSDPINDAARALSLAPWEDLTITEQVRWLNAAGRLAEAGLLVTPAHDAAVAAKALRDTAERIRAVVENPRWESERFTEHALIDAGVERLLNDYADLIGPIEASHE